MRYLVNVLDVIYAIIKKIREQVPQSEHYFNLPEDYSPPCFLYRMVFNSDTRKTKYTKDVKLDLQIIYFGDKDLYGISDYEEKLKVMEQLRGFLSCFFIQVGDRYLNFEYSFGEADGQLTTNMLFKFKDGLIDIKYDEEQAREMMQKIYINKEEIV
ncbi:phage tail terminator family protein [Niameybacter massiliensis]|uniref:phage tail terminator family protein n=1 Tax=Niameybacter massiliensis TaxID=1658108 RepID=UPI0018E2111B|nr:hypothetical protein [Niameybacter massiliensis]